MHSQICFADITTLISTISVGEQNILCSRKFLFDAVDNPTAFCTVQGTYVLYMEQHLGKTCSCKIHYWLKNFAANSGCAIQVTTPYYDVTRLIWPNLIILYKQPYLYCIQ